MPRTPSRRASTNRILSSLSRRDFSLLEPHLESIDLPLRRPLEKPNKRIEHIYFLESGFASVVANGSGNRIIEVGIVGREGMTGLAVVMGTDRTPQETFIQHQGAGQRITAAKLRQGIAQSATLHRSFLLYAHAFGVQTAHTAMANGRSKIEARLARWLLMAHDRVDGHELVLTHEFLAMMLGVRRPGVTAALSVLEKDGLISAHRRVISIIDRKRLEKRSNGAYGAPEAEFRRLFG
jgi:CRP-like cAMP-binding protein